MKYSINRNRLRFWHPSFITIGVFISLSFQLHGQLPVYEWGLVNSGTLLTTIPNTTPCTDENGNVFVAGTFTGNTLVGANGVFVSQTAVIEDAYIKKYSPGGVLQWSIAFGGVGKEQIHDLVTDLTGAVYVSGYFTESVDFDAGPNIVSKTSTGGTDVFVAKYSTNGAFEWVYTFGGALNDIAQTMDITAENDVVIAGYYSNTAYYDNGISTDSLTTITNDSMAWFEPVLLQTSFGLKLSQDGSFEWIKKIASFTNFGGTGYIIANPAALHIDNEGNIITSGSFHHTVDFDPSESEFIVSAGNIHHFYISKLDSEGAFIWVKTAGGHMIGNALDSDAEGNFYVVGEFRGTQDFDPGVGVYNLSAAELFGANTDIFILKLDSNGSFVWANKIGKVNHDIAASVFIKNDGTFYISGSSPDSTDVDPGLNGVQFKMSHHDTFFRA